MLGSLLANGRDRRTQQQFYECFFDGLESSHIDYDARKRDVSIEMNRCAARAKIETIIRGLQNEPMLRGDAGLTEEARKLALDRFRLIQPHLEQS